MAPDAQPDDDRHWSLESLNKAYQQGYMAGLTGHPNTRRGDSAKVLAAGWDDGHEQLLRQQKSA